MESGIDSVDSDLGMDDSSSPVEPEVRTEDVLNNRIKDLTGSEHSYENVYVEIPKVNLDTIIIKNDVVHDEIDNSFRRDEESFVPTSDDLPAVSYTHLTLPTILLV